MTFLHRTISNDSGKMNGARASETGLLGKANQSWKATYLFNKRKILDHVPSYTENWKLPDAQISSLCTN